MKIMIFVEGTVLMHQGAIGVSREEAVTLVKIDEASVHDFSTYVPTNGSLEKINHWKNQGATIYYLSSRRTISELDDIRNVLAKYVFPDRQNLVYRNQGEDYKNVAERIMPDILIEDDCESIGGVAEMTYPHIDPEKMKLIESVVVQEFGGINGLPNDTILLLK